MDRTDMPIVLLAAGQSRRMRGADKLLETVEGQPLIRRQAAMARAATTGPVIVTLPARSGPGPHPRHDALAGLDVTRIEVPDAAEGMNASLRAGFAALPADARLAMLLLADLPELTAQDLAHLAAAADPGSDMLVWRGTAEDGAPGHPIVFAAPLFDAFARLSGDAGGRAVVKAAGARVALIPLPGQRARCDLDTPEDWARWRAARRDGDRADG